MGIHPSNLSILPSLSVATVLDANNRPDCTLSSPVDDEWTSSPCVDSVSFCFIGQDSLCQDLIQTNQSKCTKPPDLKGCPTYPSSVDTSRTICGLESSPRPTIFHLLIPDPHVCWKSKGPRFRLFTCQQPGHLNEVVAPLFPRAPARGCTVFAEAEQRQPLTWAASQPDGPSGGFFLDF